VFLLRRRLYPCLRLLFLEWHARRLRSPWTFLERKEKKTKITVRARCGKAQSCCYTDLMVTGVTVVTSHPTPRTTKHSGGLRTAEKIFPALYLIFEREFSPVHE
jgi:hypothetical protein